MTRKLNFALTIRGKITQLDRLVADLNKLDEIYKDSGYRLEGINPIIEADLVGHDITPQDLANVSVFIENVNLFLNGGDPLVFDYSSKINMLRNMPDG